MQHANKLTYKKLKSEDVDLKKYLFIILKKWYLFLIGIVIALFIANTIIKYTEPVFMVNGKLLISSENTSLGTTIGGLDLFNGDQNFYNQVGVLKSYDLISKTISHMDVGISYSQIGDVRNVELYKSAPFQVVLDSSSFQLAEVAFKIKILSGTQYAIEAEGSPIIYDVLSNSVEGRVSNYMFQKTLVFGQKYTSENLSFTLFLTEPNFKKDVTYTFTIKNKINLTQSYKNRLVAEPEKLGSSIVVLSLVGPVQSRDIDFINKHMEVFIQSSLEEKDRMVVNTIRFIDEQIKQISDNLEGVEGQLETFMKSKGVLDMTAEATNATAKLDDLDKEKGHLIVNINYYQYLKDYIESNRDINEVVVPSSIGIQDEILNGLITKLISLRSERRAITKKTSGSNPYVANLDNEIKITTENLLESVRNILANSNQELKSLNASIYKIEMQLDKLPSNERELLKIQRRFNLNDNLFKFLLEKKAEAGITKAANKADHSIVDQARAIGSMKIKPNESLIYNAAIVMGLFTPILIIALMTLWNDKITSQEELANRITLPIVGVVGHNKYKQVNIISQDYPKSAIAEAFRSLRINLAYLNPEKDHKVISVTSSISGEGKTFISKNLSASLALAGHKVVLIGADLRKPKLQNDFKFDNSQGLSTYLSNHTQYEQLVLDTTIENYKIIASGPIPPNPNELLGLKKFSELIERLSKEFDYIIIDTPPIGLVADTMLIMKSTDINLFIVRCNYTRIAMLDEFQKMYDNNNLKNYALVMNDYESSVGQYKYGYGYNYGYGYYEEGEKKSNKILNLLRRK